MISESQAHKFCCEDITKIEGYAEAVADNACTWDCHHRLGVRDGKTITDELKANNMYENRPANELIFVTRKQHKDIHKDQQKKWHVAGGKASGGWKHHTTEHQREAGRKGGKKGGKIAAAKYNSLRFRNCWWWNNGVVNRRGFTCPGPEWVRGRVKKRTT